MERGKKTSIITFALVAIVVASSLPMPCAALDGPPSMQLTQSMPNVSQYVKPDFRNLVYAEHNNADTSMDNACEKLSIAMVAKNNRQVVKAYNAIAWSYFCRNNFGKAETTYLSALQICDSIGDRRGTANCYHDIANTLVMMNRYNEANEYDHKALNIFYEMNDEDGLSKVCRTLGLLCITHHLYNQAEEYLNRALDIDIRMNIRTHNNSNNIALDYMYLGLNDYRKNLDTRIDSLLRRAKIKNLRAYKEFKSDGNTTTIADACKNLMCIYLRYAQNSQGDLQQKYLDSSLMFHNFGLTAVKKAKNDVSKIDYLLGECKMALENGKYDVARKRFESTRVAVDKDPFSAYYLKYGFLMVKYFESVGDYRRSFEWADWTKKLERRQLNREYAVLSARLSLKNEQDKILLQNEIDTEHEYIKHREQEIRLVVITASTVLVLVLITILVVVIRNSLQRKKRLGRKLKDRNEELESQRDQLEIVNDQLQSSINFAHSLQTSMVPTAEQMNEMFGNTLILWRPLDLVSGDFYWATQSGRRKLVTIADCTGHGVPGGFMSMLGVSLLSDITLSPEFKNGQMTAGNVLDIMREKVVESLRQSDADAMALDGMDMAVCIIDEDSTTLQFAGAFRPLLLERNGSVTEYKGDRMPISFLSHSPRPFNTVRIDIEPGDTIFIYSDGITDQFGYKENGETSKFTGRRLQTVLTENAGKPFDEIQKQINDAIENWRSPAQQRTIPQTDDIILLGIRF